MYSDIMKKALEIHTELYETMSNAELDMRIKEADSYEIEDYSKSILPNKIYLSHQAIMDFLNRERKPVQLDGNKLINKSSERALFF